MKEQGNLITFMSPALGGGIGRTIVNLANASIGLGCRVHLLLDDLEHPFNEFLASDIETYHLRTSNSVTGMPFLAAYMIKHKPSVLLAPVVRQTVFAVRTRTLLRSSSRVFAIIHNSYSKSFKTLNPRKKQARVRKIQKYYPRCDGIIAVSKGVSDDFCSLTGLPGSSVHTLYNAVVTEELGRLAQSPIEHPWFYQDQPPVILGAGRLHVQKNFPLLIEAFEIIRERMICHLVIIGDGPERENLKVRVESSRYSDDIFLAGYQKNPFSYMRQASVFVLSSIYEGLPTILIEALAVGTPVVATDCPSGPMEILEAGRYGPIVPMNEPNALSQAILETLQNPLPEEELRKAAVKYQDHDVARAYLRIFGLDGDE